MFSDGQTTKVSLCNQEYLSKPKWIAQSGAEDFVGDCQRILEMGADFPGGEASLMIPSLLD